jgi:probable rRNA maturation factor
MVEVYAISRAVAIPGKLLRCLEDGWNRTFRLLKDLGIGEIASLENLEISLLDDDEMARVHRNFLQDDRPTDVITFAHGELLIGVETACRQAREYGTGIERELALYGIHGMLHLAGFDDRNPDDFEKMAARQEELCAEIFEPVLGRQSFFHQSDSTD